MDGHNPWWHPDGDEADGYGHYPTDDLFELVWQAKGGGGGGGGVTVSSLRSSQVPAIPPLLASPPSEDVMASWLYPIVSGHDHAGVDVLGQPVAKQASETPTTMAESEGMLGTKDTNTTRSENKASGSGSSSRKVASSHHSGTHKLAEKKRRCRINERLRTLQRLVPGCDKSKSNQASTLEQAIKYIKSLQQQVQAMNTWPPAPPPPPAALYPLAMPMPMPMPPPTVVAPRTPAQMVPLGAMLPYPHYQAMLMPAAAAAAPRYPHQQSGAATSATAADHTQCSVSVEQQHQHQHQHNNKEKGGRRLCPRPKNGSRESRS